MKMKYQKRIVPEKISEQIIIYLQSMLKLQMIIKAFRKSEKLRNPQ